MLRLRIRSLIARVAIAGFTGGLETMNRSRLEEAARELLVNNVRDGYSALLDAHYCYVMPSRESYQFQWFWDTCFHVFILCATGCVELAQRNMQSLFRMQEDDGFVGHMIFWSQVLPHRPSDVLQARPSLQSLRPHMSALLQPPLVAQAVKRIWEASEDRLFLYEMLPKLVRYHDWLNAARSFDGDSLLTIISPFESGIDWKPSFDEALGMERRRMSGLFTSWLYWKVVASVDGANFLHRYDLARIAESGAFLVKEVVFNTLHACDLRALAELCELAALPERASECRARARATGEAIVARMYDPETAAFYDLAGKEERQLRALTAASFVPLLLPEVSDHIAGEIVRRHLDAEDEFNCPYPIPSLAINDPAFNPGGSLALWRGPTWPVMNWLLCRCLRRRGFQDHADRLHRSVTDLIEKSGFREYYNPFTGEGHGAQSFTWSALAVDMAS